ncbi:DNA cytosine methyltransferase [Clostridium cuniculi]|uniref:DNA cytosine methyltransferase n=1 Tax=Clostridium cuniculi TaxID=2548455 RepID=UPI0018AA5E58|nr:DNA cytosine methyltransferase [Clostridium cuniculi]
MLKLGTVFSGIGAVEHALERLNIPYEIQFACDNGERKLKAKYEEIEEITKGMNNSERNAYITQLYNQTGVNYVEQTYKANFQIPDERFFQDAKLLDGTEFCGNVDLFVGGSPCQSFSVMGKRKGLEEARGTLFYEYARLVQEVQPTLAEDKGRQEKKAELIDFLHEQTTEFEEFDDGLVRRLIEQVTVHENGTFTVEFKSGTMVEV